MIARRTTLLVIIAVISLSTKPLWAVSVSPSDISEGTYLYQTTFSGKNGFGLVPDLESSVGVSYCASNSEGWVRLDGSSPSGELVLKFNFTQSRFHPLAFTFETALGFYSPQQMAPVSVANYYSLDGKNWIHIADADVSIGSFCNPPKIDTGTVMFLEPQQVDVVYFKAVITQPKATTDGIRWGLEGASVKRSPSARLLDSGHGFAIRFSRESVR